MSSADRLTDIATRHAVFVNRYGGGQSREAIALLDRLRVEIINRLKLEPSDFRRERLTAVLNDVESLSLRMMGNIRSTVAANAGQFAISEAEFTAGMVEQVLQPGVAFDIPSSDQLIAAVRNAPMSVSLVGSGKTLDNYLAEFAASKTAEISRILSDGVLLGDTTPEIAQRVSDLMITKQRHQVDVLVRTIINHTSSVSRNQMYADNNDILLGYEWVSTLDNRTTLTCAGRDGKLYQPGGPMPPAHWNCRSTTIPAVNPKFTIAQLSGERAAKGSDGPGPVGPTTYGPWLKKQSPAFQDVALGPERAALFRSGGIKIEGFTDPTGIVYTLDQLRAMHPLAFQ